MRRAAIASQWPIFLSALAALMPWPAAPAEDVPAAGLATFRVESAPVPEERLLDGTVEAVNQSTVSAQTAGRIDAVNVDVNDRVATGTVMLRIRSSEQVAGLTQAQAALKEAVAREAEAQQRYQRINDMYQRHVVARATLDEASAARDAAVARASAARAGLDAAREGVAYTEVRTPYSGVVTQKFVQLGELVAPGTPLVAVASLDALRVVVEVPQSVIEQVRKVQKAIVFIDGQRVEAAGLTLFPSAQPKTSTFRVRIELPKSVQGLAPGMFVKVGLVTGAADLLLVPRAAVVERSEMRAVYVLGPDGRVSLRQVRLGHVRGDQIEILAGLVAGDTIARDPAAAAARAYRQGVKRD
jgi:RND family efflux transporter MFP subunit